MLIPIKKAIIIQDGQHEGVIIAIRYRQKPFPYVDVEIEMMQGADSVELKVGYPQVVSKNSQLGQLLIRFGEILQEGNDIDPDKVLIGKKCKFATITETNPKGKFARIVAESLRPSAGLQSALI